MTMRKTPIQILSAAALIAVVACIAHAGFEVTDEARVYYGNPDVFQAPATVSASTVFDEIEEWQEIQDQGLEPGNPRYEMLLKKANAKFSSAIKHVAGNQEYDLVAETGAVESDDGEFIPDISFDVIDRINAIEGD